MSMAIEREAAAQSELMLLLWWDPGFQMGCFKLEDTAEMSITGSAGAYGTGGMW